MFNVPPRHHHPVLPPFLHVCLPQGHHIILSLVSLQSDRELIPWILTLIQWDPYNPLSDYRNTHRQVRTFAKTHARTYDTNMCHFKVHCVKVGVQIPDVHPLAIDVLVKVLQKSKRSRVSVTVGVRLCVFLRGSVCYRGRFSQSFQCAARTEVSNFVFLETSVWQNRWMCELCVQYHSARFWYCLCVIMCGS